MTINGMEVALVMVVIEVVLGMAMVVVVVEESW